MGDSKALGTTAAATADGVRWAKVVDHESCIGCHACTTACKSENEVPLSVTRTYVKYVEVGSFPQAHRAFQVTRCNQCDRAPCTTACPTRAMYRRADGIVDFDKSICIGCKACIAACPYDAIFINPEDSSAEKCNFCAHRLDIGLEPACVVVCPTEALLVGDMNDPSSRVSQIVHREPVSVRRPEKDTAPKLFYRGARQATLDPLAALRPGGGLFSWSQQKSGPHHVVSGSEGPSNSSAAALLSYDVPHSIPWDWKVSLYTVTKGIASGAYLVGTLLTATGVSSVASQLWLAVIPFVALLFLGLTGLLLLADLEHPERFYLIFTRPQWSSWLVRGAFLIAAYGVALAAHLAIGWWAGVPPPFWLVSATSVLAIATAVYTAYLLAQAKARDLWQSPLLPAHLLVQSLLLGGAVLYPILTEAAARSASLLVAASALVHLLLLAGETSLTHATAHTRRALAEMTRGRYRSCFWTGLFLVAFSLTCPVTGSLAALAAVAGLAAHEHAYLQAAQAVPLA